MIPKHTHTMLSGWGLTQRGGLPVNLCLVFHKRQSFESKKATVVSL